MKLIFFAFTMFLISSLASAQTKVSPEQIALDFFVDVIWPSKYYEVKKILYNGKTGTTTSDFAYCSEGDSSFIEYKEIKRRTDSVRNVLERMEHKTQFVETLDICNPTLRLLKKPGKLRNSKQGYITVWNSTLIGTTAYVSICLYFFDNSIKSMMIEIDRNNYVTHWCAED